MRYIKKCFILIIVLFFAVCNVQATDVTFYGSGTATYSTGDGGGGGGTCDGNFCFALSRAMKVNLVKVNDDDSITPVSYYYVYSLRYGNDTDKQAYRFFMASTQHTTRNLYGTAVTLGQITSSGYSYGITGASKVITDRTYGWGENGSAFLIPSATWGFNFSVDNLKASLNGGTSDMFYQMVYEALKKEPPYNDDSGHFTIPRMWTGASYDELATNIGMDSITSWEDIKTLFEMARANDSSAINRLSSLNNYKILIEPIYEFRIPFVNDSTHHYQVYATLKASAYYTVETHKLPITTASYVSSPGSYSVNLAGYGDNPASKMANNANFSDKLGYINKGGFNNTGVQLADVFDANQGFGYVAISITDNVTPTTPTIPTPTSVELYCPIGTIGVNGKSDGTDTPFNNYYMALTKETQTDVSRVYSSQILEYNDAEIFDNIIANYTTSSTIAGLSNRDASKILVVNNGTGSTNSQIQIEDYYKYYNLALNSSKKYYQNGGDYYLYNSYSGSLLSENVNSTLKLGTKEPFKTNYRVPELSNISISLNSDLSGNYTSSIGFETNLAYDDSYLGSYYSPSIIRLSYCVQQITPTIPNPTTTTCDDTVAQATCNTTDRGTTAVFKENDNLAGCTLDSSKASGFIMIDSSETNSYCEVACKDDIEISLPGTKKALAGTYFTLDNNGLTNTTSPVISATRTCVTSKIKYREFEEYLNNKKDALINAYNKYIDLVEYKTHINTASNITYDTHSVRIPTTPTDYRTCEVDDCSETDRCTHIKYAETCSQDDLDAGKTVCTGDYDEDNSDGCCTTEVVEDCTESDKCPHTIENPYKDNTYTTATIKSFTATNGTHWSEITKNYLGYSSCTCSGCYSVSNELQTYRNTIATEGDNAKKVYEDLLDEIIENINKYNECFNWNNTVTGATSVDTSYSTKKISSSVKIKNSAYKFQFKPTVSFGYEDEDGVNAFSGAATLSDKYTYIYGSDTKGGTVTSTSKYWTTDTIDSKYESGGTYVSRKKIAIPSCSGATCTGQVEISFYKNTYVKRTEKIQYKYELPTVYTKVPSGAVSYASGAGSIKLGENAVPINIKTSAGQYNYIITIDNLEDSIRSSKRTSKPEDRLQERFEAQVLNGTTGNDYVCKYRVTNDIYNPDEQSVTYFYRIIDPSNINPNYRRLGYNWSDSKGTTVRGMMATNEANYQNLIDESNGTFEFVVTSTIMKQIRQYNTDRASSGAYSDWDLQCYDYGSGGYHCNSNFLTCLASGGGANIDGYASCNSIFNTSLSGYSSLTSYDLNKLNSNRQNLINKQNSLDGR